MAANMVEVFIKLQSGRAVSSEFHHSDTVARIASFVAREEGGVPDRRVRLKYQGKTLDTRKTIGYLGIRPETILRGEIIEPQNIEVCAILPGDKTVKVCVQNIDTVGDLKQKIDTAGGPSTHEQNVVVKGGGNITSETHRMLCDIGVVNETVIQVTEREDHGYNPGEYSELDDTRKQELMYSFDAAGRNVEVAFCFDTTGSMYSCLNTVRKKLRQSCERLLKDIPNMRIAIMAHGDYCDYSNYVERHVDLTSNVDTVVNFAKNVPSTGGGDAPECYEWALRKCQQLDWSEDSAKAFVMIGDCLPHQPGYTDQNIFWGTELDVLIGMGVKVYGVQAYANAESTPFYKELAERSGGFYLQLSHFDLITDMFLAVCYKEANPGQLDAFIDEVQQEGRLTGDTKELLEKLEEDPKKKEEKNEEEGDKPNWWDEWLNEDIRMEYKYVSETDSWRPVDYQGSDDDDDGGDDDHGDDGGRGGFSRGRGRRRYRRRERGGRRGRRGCSDTDPSGDSAEDSWGAPLEDWGEAPLPVVTESIETPAWDDWAAPDWSAAPSEDWGSGDSDSGRGRAGYPRRPRGGRSRGRGRGGRGRGRGASDADTTGEGRRDSRDGDVHEPPVPDEV